MKRTGKYRRLFIAGAYGLMLLAGMVVVVLGLSDAIFEPKFY
jgi:hypothetical protein